MTSLILSSVAWYVFPKVIEYATSEPSSLDSRMSCIRARLFAYKSACQRLADTNQLTRFIQKAVYIPYSHMWLSILLTPGFTKLLHLTTAFYHPTTIILCYPLFYGKKVSETKLRTYINSSEFLKHIESECGFRIISSSIGLRLINQYTNLNFWNAKLLEILNQRLDYTLAQSLLKGKTSEYPDGLISRVWRSRWSDELISSTLIMIRNSNTPYRPELPDYSESILDTDPILSKMQCPISKRTPRSILIDPTNRKTIYDHKTFTAYLEHSDISPMTREKMPESFRPYNQGGSKYDSIINYRKACLSLRPLENPETFSSEVESYFIHAEDENPQIFILETFLLNLRACLELEKIKEPEIFFSFLKSVVQRRSSLSNLASFTLEISIANLETMHAKKESIHPEKWVSEVFIPNLEKAYVQLEPQNPKEFISQKLIPLLENTHTALKEVQDPTKFIPETLLPRLENYLKSQKECLDLEAFQGTIQSYHEKFLIQDLEQGCLRSGKFDPTKELISKELLPILAIYFKQKELQELKELISTELVCTLEMHLRLKKLHDPIHFMANLKQTFAEISTLNHPDQIKTASEEVRDFFSGGFFRAYNVSDFYKPLQKINRLEKDLEGKSSAWLEDLKESMSLTSKNYKFWKKQHNIHQYEDNMKSIGRYPSKNFVGVSIDDFEQYPFIKEELRLEIQKIKLEGQELIKEFL